MSERRYEVETYESTPGNVVRFAIVDTATGHWLCNCPCIEDADKIAAALNAAEQLSTVNETDSSPTVAAEQAARERELLNRAEEFASFMQFVVRGEPALAHSAATRAKCNRAEKWLAEYAALQTEGHDAKKQSS